MTEGRVTKRPAKRLGKRGQPPKRIPKMTTRRPLEKRGFRQLVLVGTAGARPPTCWCVPAAMWRDTAVPTTSAKPGLVFKGFACVHCCMPKYLFLFCFSHDQKNIFADRSGHKEACKKNTARDAAGQQSSAVLPCVILARSILAIEAGPAPLAQSPTSITVCGFCREAKEKLLLCGKCKKMRYCNADHQRQHWLIDDRLFPFVPF